MVGVHSGARVEQYCCAGLDSGGKLGALTLSRGGRGMELAYR